MLVILKHVRCLNVMLLHFGLAIMGKVFSGNKSIHSDAAEDYIFKVSPLTNAQVSLDFICVGPSLLVTGFFFTIIRDNARFYCFTIMLKIMVA